MVLAPQSLTAIDILTYKKEHSMVDTTHTIGSISSPQPPRAVDGAPEIEITPAMIAAGDLALSRRFFDLCDGNEYPQIARIVFEAMMEARRAP